MPEKVKKVNSAKYATLINTNCKEKGHQYHKHNGQKIKISTKII